MKYDVIIIGGGVVGCAAAFELSRYCARVLLLEKENDVADATTKANSGIVHAGYDPEPGTLMARLNVRGCERMPQLCADLDVPFRQTGSLVLAFGEKDNAHIRRLYENGIANGVPELSLLSGDEVRALEPNVNPAVTGALLAKTAGVVSPWELALALGETAVRNGVEIRCNAEVTGLQKNDSGYTVQTADGEYSTRFLVSAAGVSCGRVRAMLREPDYEIRPSKGEYYLLDKAESGLTSRVLFVCPNENGKGVLVSPTAHGNIIVGPNAQSCAPDDTATSSDGLAFVRKESARIMPGLQLRGNIRNFAGVRANSDQSDFRIGEVPGCPGFIEAACIKSPGLTSAPAIAEEIVRLLQNAGLTLRSNPSFRGTRRVIRFNRLSHEERAALIRRDPAYGRVICRCETVTEGEIRAALRSPIPPTTVDAVKRRCGTGMGRCQGGFCGPRVHALLAEFLGVPLDAVEQDKNGSRILIAETKEASRK